MNDDYKNMILNEINTLTKNDIVELIDLIVKHKEEYALYPGQTILQCIKDLHKSKSKTKTIRECIEECEKRRPENSREYREAVRKSNELIKEYELQQAQMLREAQYKVYL